ncbi:MAG: ATP-binding protein [Myxococcota bacterium]|jgi:hypothetical protein|nr:ATP-binding protein [Myxococcota bacterium]
MAPSDELQVSEHSDETPPAEDSIGSAPFEPLGDAENPQAQPTPQLGETGQVPNRQEALDALIDQLHTQLEQASTFFGWSVLEPARLASRELIDIIEQRCLHVLDELLTHLQTCADEHAASAWLRRARTELNRAVNNALRTALFDVTPTELDGIAQLAPQILALHRALPVAISVPLSVDIFAPTATDSTWLAVRKRWARLLARLFRHDERIVQLQALAVARLAQPVAQLSLPLTNMGGYLGLLTARKAELTTRFVDDALLSLLQASRDPHLLQQVGDEPPATTHQGAVQAAAPSPSPSPLEQRENSSSSTETVLETGLEADLQPGKPGQVPNGQELQSNVGEQAKSPIDKSLGEQAKSPIDKKSLILRQVQALRHDSAQEFVIAKQDLDLLCEELLGRLRSRIDEGFVELRQDVLVADTFLLASVDLSEELNANDTAAQCKLATERWSLLRRVSIARSLLGLEYSDFEQQALAHCLEAQHQLEQLLLIEVLPLLDRVRVDLREASARLENLLHSTFIISKLINKLDRYRDQLCDSTLAGTIASFENARRRKQFDGVLEPFFTRLEMACAELSPSFELLNPDALYQSEGQTPPALNTEELPLRELANVLFVSDLPLHLAPINTSISRALEQTIANLSDTLRIVHFNLDAAQIEAAQLIADVDPSTSLDGAAALTDPNHPLSLLRDYALGGLQRGVERCEELAQQLESTNASIADTLRRELEQQLSSLQRLALHEKPAKARSFLQAKVQRQRTRQTEEGLQGMLLSVSKQVSKQVQQQVVPLLSRSLKELHDGFTGASEDPLEQAIALDNASFAAVQNDAVPAAYRRLFSCLPVELEELFVGRQAELQRLALAYQRFENQRAANVLISAPIAAGKTSFVEHGLRSLAPGFAIERLSLNHSVRSERELLAELAELFRERVRDWSQLRSRLRSRGAKRRRIIFIDGLHRCFQRTLDGFDGISRLLPLIADSAPHYWWLIAINSETLPVLIQNTPLLRSFDAHIDLSPLHDAEIVRLLEARHAVSGFKRQFSARSNAPQARLQRDFEKSITQQALGHPTRALFLYLRALRGLKDDVIQLNHVSPLDDSLLDTLDDEQRLGLACIMMHGALSLADFTRILRLPHEQAQLLLSSLVHANLLLVEHGRVDTYSTNRVIAPALRQRLLASRML